MRSRPVFLLLVLTMLLTCTPAAAENGGWLVPKVRDAPAFSDVAGVWCEPYVRTVYEAGLMEGKNAGCFDPGGTLTEAQRLVIGVRLHALLHGRSVEPAASLEPWWYPAARYYLAVEVDSAHTPAGFFPMANQPASRLSFACQMAWSTPAELLPVINRVDEDVVFSQLSGEFGEQLLTLYRAGILNGVDPWGTFDPQGALTRGQAAAMLARIIDPSLRLTFTLLPFDLCRDVYRLDQETVMLTVDDEPISLERFVYPLSVSLCEGAAAGTPAALTELRDGAVARVLKNLAIERLAAEQQPPLTLAPLPFFLASTGLPQAAVDAEATAYFLYHALMDLYTASGSSQEALDADLERLSASMTVIPAPALENLDLASAQARLLASPYCH